MLLTILQKNSFQLEIETLCMKELENENHVKFLNYA